MPDVDYLQYAQLMNQRNPFAESLAGIGKTLQAGRQQDIQEEQMRRAARLSDIQARSGEATLAGTLAEQEGMRRAYGAENLPGAYAAKEKATMQSAVQKQAMEKGGLIKDMFDKTYSAVDKGTMEPEEAEAFFKGTMKMAGIDFEKAGMKFSFTKKGGYYSGPINEQSLFMMNGKPVPFGNKGIVEKAHVVGVAPDGVSPIYQMDENTKFSEPKAEQEALMEKRFQYQSELQSKQIAAQDRRLERQLASAEKRAAVKDAKSKEGKPLPATQLESITDMKKVRDTLMEAQDMANKISTGPAVGRLQSIGATVGLAGDEFTNFQQKLASVENIMLKLRSGAAVTDQEFARFKREYPNPNDPPNVLKRKLENTIAYATTLMGEKLDVYEEGGYKVPRQAVSKTPPKSATTGAPSAAPTKRPPLSSFRKR